MKNFMIIVLTILQGSLTFAANRSKANIICDRKAASDVYHLEAYLLFPKGFISYGPTKNELNGEMNFSFLDGTDNSVAYTQVSGYQVKGAQFGHPDFWVFRAVSKKGEIITVDLRSDTVGYDDYKGFLYGTIARQNGQKYSAICRFKIN